MRINNNLMAMNTHRQLGINNGAGSKSVEKLSSGFRINRAGDDAAGLAISEKMRSQIRGLSQASRNSQDGISLIQTAEGALAETHDMLQRMRELAVQANNGTNTASDVAKIQSEIDELVTEVDAISDRTEFNNQKVIDGTLGATIANAGADVDGTGTSVVKIADVTGAEIGADYNLSVDAAADTMTLTNSGGTLAQTIDITDDTAQTVGTVYNFDKIGVKVEVTAVAITGLDGTANDSEFDVTASGIKFQIGANSSQELAVSINSMKANQLGNATHNLTDVDVEDFTTVTFAEQLDAIDSAIEDVSTERSKLGAYQNRLEHTIKNLDTSAENLQASESRIRDVDMAKEMMNFTKNNILQQAAQAMLAQANQAPQGVLQLLR